MTHYSLQPLVEPPLMSEPLAGIQEMNHIWPQMTRSYHEELEYFRGYCLHLQVQLEPHVQIFRVTMQHQHDPVTMTYMLASTPCSFARCPPVLVQEWYLLLLRCAESLNSMLLNMYVSLTDLVCKWLPAEIRASTSAVLVDCRVCSSEGRLHLSQQCM